MVGVRGDMEMATKVFDLASKMNVVPDVVLYTTVIRGWCERGCEDRAIKVMKQMKDCLLYTSPSPRDMRRSRMPSSA